MKNALQITGELYQITGTSTVGTVTAKFQTDDTELLVNNLQNFGCNVLPEEITVRESRIVRYKLDRTRL